MAPAGVDVYLAINVFSVVVDDVFPVELLVVLKQFVCLKSVRIDGQRLLVTVGEQESYRRSLGGFRCHDVPLVRASVNQNEHRKFVLVVRFYAEGIDILADEHGWVAPSSLSVEGVRKRVRDIKRVRKTDDIEGDFQV